ncbi:Histone-lysine N-methyltransferase NSD3 [Nowakowskiella sp. JEL0407]|nr:Histone-lysine N-methyltransferase NSD3 [Nowakowskiella sp. JEL0407]
METESIIQDSLENTLFGDSTIISTDAKPTTTTPSTPPTIDAVIPNSAEALIERLSENSTSSNDFPDNTLVWARVKGYRWWPAKVQSLDLVPENVKRVPHKEGSYPVCFYATREYAWITPDSIVHYAENKTKYSTPANQKSFIQALKEIEETPHILDYPLIEEPVEPKTPESKKRRQSSGGSGSVTKKTKKDEKEKVSTTPSRSRRKSALNGLEMEEKFVDDEKKKKPRKTPVKPAKQEEPITPPGDSAAVAKSKREEAFFRISKRINKFYKEPETLTREDLDRISKLVEQVETLSYDAEFFRATKIEKVVRRVRKMTLTERFPVDEFNIISRCREVYEKWYHEKVAIAAASGVVVGGKKEESDEDSDVEKRKKLNGGEGEVVNAGVAESNGDGVHVESASGAGEMEGENVVSGESNGVEGNAEIEAAESKESSEVKGVNVEEQL